MLGQIYGSAWIISADAATMWHMAVKNWEKMKRCFAWKICLFILIILRIAMRIIMSNGHLIRILLQHELRRQENPGKWQVRRRKKLLREQEKSAQQEVNLKKLMEENASLKEKLSARRQEQQSTYVPKPLDLSEYKTRKLYIDAMLMDAGWVEGKDWINEVEIPGMPNKSELGRADYVLYDDRQQPLAVIEAKRTCVDVSRGRQQAQLYADLLEKKHHRRPVIFLTNGFETHIIDGQYPERKCSMIYSKRDLEKWFNLLTMRTSLKHITVDKEDCRPLLSGGGCKGGMR